MSSSSTSIGSIAPKVAALRATFDSNVTLTQEFRVGQLHRLRKLLTEGRETLREALYKDLHRSRFEADFLEMNVVDHELQYALDNIGSWMAPKSVKTNFLAFPAASYIVRDPRGVVLIMAPWNYPIQLLLAPLVGALAAGNTVMLKPAEFTVHTSKAIADLVNQHFDRGVVEVVTGGKDENIELLKQRYDYIFFTGGSVLGRVVHAAANKHLTPVTLELGGKSPCYISKSADIDITCKRLTWGTFINCGQTCVRPDYLMVDKEIAANVIASLKTSIAEFYRGAHSDEKEYQVVECRGSVSGGTLGSSEESAYLGRIVDGNDAISRVASIIDKDRQFIVEGGQYNKATRYVAPTLLFFNDDVKAFEASQAMQAEIFGPILPIVIVDGAAGAVAQIRKREKPLALYVYTTDSATKRIFETQTSSGGLVFNDNVIHLANHSLPFGGVGMSGMGSYHGAWSYAAFTHEKSVMSRPFIGDMPARYPPYTSGKRTLIGSLGAPVPKATLKIIVFLLVCGLSYYKQPALQSTADVVLPMLVKALPFVLGYLAAYFF